MDRLVEPLTIVQGDTLALEAEVQADGKICLELHPLDDNAHSAVWLTGEEAFALARWLMGAQLSDIRREDDTLTSRDVEFLMAVLRSEGAKLDGFEFDIEAEEPVWRKAERLSLVSCVGSYKWVPTSLLLARISAALAAT